MTWDIFILLLSMSGLLISADVFVSAVVRLAEHLKVSTLVIGLTVVAIGTSLPEVAASAAAALRDHPEIAFGNVVGSNICNVGLILGFPAILVPVVCNPSVVRREGTQMLIVTALFWILAVLLGEVTRLLGLAYIVLFVAYVLYAFTGVKKDTAGSESDHDFTGVAKEALQMDEEGLAETVHGMALLIVRMVLSLAVLLLSSEYVVQSTINLARLLDISETVIALSLIALGTSLPELSVSVAAAKRNEGDIIVGNIVGSNISNILLVIGVSGAINPFYFEPSSLRLDLPFMGVLSLLMMLFLAQKSGISRTKGLVLLALYGIFIWRCFAYPN